MKIPLVVRVSCFWLALLFVVPTARNQQSDRRDGNWWGDRTRLQKLDYVTGFFDGMELGGKFSYWGMEDDKHGCSVKAVKGYSTYSNKYLAEVTNGQIADGLDKFYSDYRNRRILIANGVWLVLNEITGKSQQEMDKMIENWRKNAVPPDSY